MVKEMRLTHGTAKPGQRVRIEGTSYPPTSPWYKREGIVKSTNGIWVYVSPVKHAHETELPAVIQRYVDKGGGFFATSLVLLEEEQPAMKFKVGDRVRANATWRSFYGKQDHSREWVNAICTVERVGGDTYSIFNPVLGSQQIVNDGYLEAAPEEKQEAKPVSKTGAMGFEQARAQRQRLIEAGAAPAEQIRLVTRTWDHEGRFAAVDVRPGFFANGKPQLHFQNERQVDEYLANFKPIDVPAYYSKGDMYYFRHEGTIIRPSGNRMKEWWTLAEIQQVSGIASQDGRRYRLGVTKFVPLVDTEKA